MRKIHRHELHQTNGGQDWIIDCMSGINHVINTSIIATTSGGVVGSLANGFRNNGNVSAFRKIAKGGTTGMIVGLSLNSFFLVSKFLYESN